MNFEFGSASSKFRLGFTLKNTFQSSLEVMDKSALPPLPIVPLYSIARDIPMIDNGAPHRYGEVDLVI